MLSKKNITFKMNYIKYYNKLENIDITFLTENGNFKNSYAKLNDFNKKLCYDGIINPTNYGSFTLWGRVYSINDKKYIQSGYINGLITNKSIITIFSKHQKEGIVKIHKLPSYINSHLYRSNFYSDDFFIINDVNGTHCFCRIGHSAIKIAHNSQSLKYNTKNGLINNSFDEWKYYNNNIIESDIELNYALKRIYIINEKAY